MFSEAACLKTYGVIVSRESLLTYYVLLWN